METVLVGDPLYISFSMPNLQLKSWMVFTNYRERESKFPSELNGHSQDQSKSNMFQHVMHDKRNIIHFLATYPALL